MRHEFSRVPQEFPEDSTRCGRLMTRRSGFPGEMNGVVPPGTPLKLVPFEYRDVRLLPGRRQRRMLSARDYYLSVNEDDFLHGFRAAAGLSLS